MKKSVKKILISYRKWSQADPNKADTWEGHRHVMALIDAEWTNARRNNWAGYSKDDVLALGAMNQSLRAIPLHMFFGGVSIQSEVPQ